MRRNRRLGCPPFWGPWISGVCWKVSWTHCRLCCPAISSRRCRLRGKPYDRSVLQNSRRLRVVFTFLFTLYPSLCARKNGLLLHSSLNETPLLTDEECGFCREVISAVVALYRSLSRRGAEELAVEFFQFLWDHNLFARLLEEELPCAVVQELMGVVSGCLLACACARRL